MKDTCPDCAGGPHQQALKEIHAIPGSRICRCTSCGAYWLEQEGKWDLLLFESNQLHQAKSA